MTTSNKASQRDIVRTLEALERGDYSDRQGIPIGDSANDGDPDPVLLSVHDGWPRWDTADSGGGRLPVPIALAALRGALQIGGEAAADKMERRADEWESVGVELEANTFRAAAKISRTLGACPAYTHRNRTNRLGSRNAARSAEYR